MQNRKFSIKFLLYLVAVSLVLVTAANAQAPQKEQLLNGLKVLMWPDAKADKVWVRVRIHAGSAFDPLGREGVMQLLADNLFPGPSAKEFFTEDLNGSLDTDTTYDYIKVTASAKPDSMLTMLETLSTAISNPTIEKDQTANLRNVLLARVKDLETDPGYVADRAAAKRLIGTFPYGRPQFGTPDSLQKIDFADLIDAKQRLLTADNATITVSGNFDKALTFRAIRRYFGSWLKADKKVPNSFRQPDDPPPGLLSIPSPKDASATRIAIRGVARNDKEMAASLVFTSILEARLRSKLSPEVWIRNEPHSLPGVITVGVGSAARTADQKSELADAFGKAMMEPVTEAEFQTARSARQAEWLKRPIEDLWLDLDTYKTTDVASDRNAFETVKLADVTAYAERLRKASAATVIVSTPAATK